MPDSATMWIAFALVFGTMLTVDLFLNLKGHEVSSREALIWSTVWIALAPAFNVGIYLTMGSDKAANQGVT